MKTTNRTALSIIIINWNTKQLLLDCIASIYKTVQVVSFEIIVVDNGSTDGTIAAIRESYPGVRIFANGRNLGFATANNRGIKEMEGEYAVLLNSDTLLKEGAIEQMLGFMEHHADAGMCGPQLLNKDGSKQNSVGNFPTLLSEFLSKKLIRIIFPKEYKQVFKPTPHDAKSARAVDYIVGACMMVRKAAIDAVGALDEDYFFLLEEVDWCYRLQQSGWFVYHIPDVAIYHLGGQSIKEINLRARVEFWHSRYLYFKKNMKLSAGQAYLLLVLGILQNTYQFLIYTLLNGFTLFAMKRLRNRWRMFAYVLLWHARGRPIGMGLPRQ